MGEKFQLTLPNAISSISVREAAALTAFSMHSEGNSVNSVLELVKKTGDAIIREQVLMALDDRVDDVIRDIPSFNTALFRSGEVDEFFVATFQYHLVYLRKLFRTGEIESREMLSNTPINQDATDRIIDSAMISLQDFVKFAETLGIGVHVEGNLMKVGVTQTVEATTYPQHSDALMYAIQASTKFWANANKSDKQTHPKNAEVVQWLMGMGLSERIAKGAATLIRPKWAQTGRRPDAEL